MSILVTGGAGYIGSHICVELLNRGEKVVVVDNLYNSSMISLDRIKKITGKELTFYEGDIRDFDFLNSVFEKEEIELVIHMAGLKAVGESVQKPLEYYDNNVNGSIVLLEAMKKNNVKKIIFSSSATVYGDPEVVPVTEETPKGRCTNAYGWTKWMIEEIMMDLHKSDKEWGVTILRYFNPVGAHESGLIGEDPKGIPNNLTPYITQVAVGKLEKLRVFGDDYDTVDGTGVRDYIHVVDLALGHVAAIDKLRKEDGVLIYNLGTGNGNSVLEVVEAFKRATNKDIPYEIAPRREGDVAAVFCNPEKAEKELGWKAKFDINKMAEDSWRWQSSNPEGYEKNLDK